MKHQIQRLTILAFVAGCFICPTTGEESKQNLYVPYQDLARLIDPADKAVLMNRNEFEKLLAAAEANAKGIDSLEVGQVKLAEYSGIVSGEQLTLTGRIEVASMSNKPTVVPLGFAQIGLTRVLLDNKPAPLGYDEQGRLILIITDKGKHQLEITGTAKLQELSSGGMQFGLSLPEAVAGAMELSFPGDIEIHATVPMSQTAYDKKADRTNVELTIGGQNSLTVVVLGNGRQEDNMAILLGQSATTVELTKTTQAMNCLYTVQVFRRGVRQLQFQLPSEWTITEVKCPSLVKWSVDTVLENETRRGIKVVTVRLRSAKVGSTALHIKASASRSGLRWNSPLVNLVGSAFQRGYLMVNTDEGLRVRGERLTNAQREDVSVSVPGIMSISTGRLYFNWGNKWSVDLEVAETALRRSIEERQKVVVSPGQLKLIGDFEVTAIERELFEMSFLLPAREPLWHIEQVLVNERTADFEYYVEQLRGRRLLRVELARPVQPEKVVNVRIVLQHVPSDWNWPSDAAKRSISVPLIGSQSGNVSGEVSISVVGDLDALPKKVPDKLEEVPVGRMASLGMDESIQHAFSYKTRMEGEIGLEISRRQPRKAADAVGLINVQSRTFTGFWRIIYTISRASARKLYLLADKSLGEKIKIESPLVSIRSKSIVTSDEKIVQLSDKLIQRYNLWQLNLDHEAVGKVAIDVSYEHPLSGGRFAIPLVRPICQGQMSELLAIQASEELEISVDVVAAKEIDAVDLPVLPVSASRILSAFRLEATTTEAGPDATLMLESSVHESYEIPSALVISLGLTTYLDVQGAQRTEARFQIANTGKQFLTFTLPKNAQLWSLRVEDEQAKPQLSTDGHYQVSLGRLRKPVGVKVVYAYQPSEANLEQIELGGIELPGLEINRISWRIVPPPGYQITSQKTKMQTRELARPTPAFVKMYNFLAENLLGGALFMPSLHKARMSKTVSYDAHLESALVTEQSFKEAESKPAAVQTKEPQQVVAGKPVQRRVHQQEQEKYFGVKLSAKGRYTLPVDLIPTPGAGATAHLTGLGAKKLIVGLTSQPKMSSWWLVGFLFIVAIGMASARKKVKGKAVLLFVVLSFASLLALWWPTTTYFANGVFIAGLCLVPIYLLVGFVRWLWVRLRLGGVVGSTSATVVCLLLSMLLFCGSAQAAKVKKTPIQKEEKKPLPSAVIPYEGDPSEAATSEKILIPYDRFVNLWNQAHPEDPIDGFESSVDVSVAEVRYKATIEDQQLKLLLTADISTYGKGWVTLDLPLSGLAVTEASFNGKTAQLQSGPKGMTLMLPSGVSGRLRLNAAAKPKYLGQRGTVKFSLPPLPGAVMNVVLPKEDLELEVDGIEGTLTRHSVKEKVEWTFALGLQREITLRWLPKVGGGAADRTLSAKSEHNVYAFHWAIVGVTKIAYSFSGGQYDRFRVLLPVSMTLTDLKGGNVRDFRQVGSKTIEGQKFDIVEVCLHRASKKQYELTVHWLDDLPRLNKPTRLILVQADDVGSESGTVTLHSTGGMIVKVTDVVGGRRVNISRHKELGQQQLTADKAVEVAKYFWPYRPFALFVQLSRLTVSPEVKLDQLVRIGSDEVRLLVQANFGTEQGQLYRASFSLPKGYELLSVVGPAVDNFYERSTEQGKFLHVKFRAAQRQTNMALVLISNESELEMFDVPIIKFIDSQDNPVADQGGRVAVQVEASLEAETISSRNIKSIVPSRLRDWLSGEQAKAVQFACLYETADPTLQLRIRQKPTRIRVEIFTGLVVKATAGTYTYRLRYNISGSPVDHLQFSMPSEYAPLVAVQSPVMRSVTQSDAGNGLTSWNLSLINEVTGTVDIAVNFALPIDTSTKELAIPKIETKAPQGYHAIIAVQNISRHDISVKDVANLAVMPVSDQRKLMSREMSQSLQYVFQSFKDDWSLSFDFKPAKKAVRIQAVVDLLSLTTVIDRDGKCRYKAKVTLQNRSEQFLRIKVPDGLRLWSAKVAEQPVKPVIAADSPADEVLIPLVKTSPGGLPYDVYLYFAGKGIGQLNGISKLKPPAISIAGMPVMQTTWSLRLPGGYRYLLPGGNMSPVAGTAEILSIGVEARLKQLGRLEKTYRDIAGYSSRGRGIARKNWDVLNQKLASEIGQAESYLESNRDQVSNEEYKQLKSKFAEQRRTQQTLIVGNTVFIRKQEEQNRKNMNVFLNASNTSTGVSEGMRNDIMLKKPEFIGENERRQIDILDKELEKSEKQRKELEMKKDTPVLQQRSDKKLQPDITVSSDMIISGDADKAGDMSKLLGGLAKEQAVQIEQQQLHLKKQLSELKDNRAQRYFSRQSGKAKRPSRKSKTKAEKGDPKRESQTSRGGKAGTPVYDYGDVAVASGVYTPTEEVPKPGTPPAGLPAAVGEQVQVYEAKGTYSLPVTLPGGEVRLDFTKPSGDAELSIWAVPMSVFHKIYGSFAVIAMLLVALGIVKLWPDSAGRQPLSTKRIVVYVLLLVGLTVILRLLGLLISLLLILLCEAVRSGFARWPAPKTTI